MFDEVLKSALARIEGAQCVLLAGLDGMPVAAAVAKGCPATDVLAASLVDLFRKVTLAHRDAGLVPPVEFTSGGSAGHAALRAVTPDYVLVAVFGSVGSLGRTRFELRKAAALLEPELA